MDDRADFSKEATFFLSMPGHLLRRCQQIGVAIFLDACRGFDLTPLQFGVLSALDGFGPMDQVRLGGVTALDRTTTVVVLRKLEERGLVGRSPSTRDKRSKMVEVTATGRALLHAALPTVQAVQDRILAPLTAKEKKQLVALLGKMAEANNSFSRAPHRLP